ncbi:class D sortase [Bacillus sp. T33-2]|uniref:class D sortase n=1 Tax=Bacillus sp. T33-2 TaxID=2054168 RepID=UPI000C76843B|nr:class D sortase [Bacillus sp. T33-2]PLR99288.1 hypothetical protein CVD19_02950 [Bacillus sp. T33-2]
MKLASSFFLITVGIIIMFSPKLISLYHSYEEEQLISTWQETKRDKVIAQYNGLEEVFAAVDAESTNKPDAGEMLGTLHIEKIDLLLPVVEGATQDNLKTAAGHLTGTSYPGQKGNAAIAAHRSYTFGRQFNRLNELEKEDVILIETKTEIYTYVVFKKSIVSPTDMEVLDEQGGIGVLTLITCEPIKNPTKRLIVQARLTT